jgi:hypothetical protein
MLFDVIFTHGDPQQQSAISNRQSAVSNRQSAVSSQQSAVSSWQFASKAFTQAFLQFFAVTTA